MVLVASVVLASAYSSWSTSYPDDHGSLGEAGTGPCHASAYACSWKNFLSFAPALFALGIWCIISVVFVSGSHCSGRLGVASECAKIGFYGRCLFSWVQYLVRQWIHILRQYFVAMDELHTFSTLRQTRTLQCCSPFCCRTEKRAQPMLLVAVCLAQFAFDNWTLFLRRFMADSACDVFFAFLQHLCSIFRAPLRS